LRQGDGASRARILITDDNAEFRGSAADILELNGYEVVEAATRDEAVERLHTEAFDLLVLDLGVDRGGLEVLDRVLVLPPVLAVSAMSDEPVDPRITAFLTKPAPPVRLLQEIAGCLGQEEPKQ
jgi:CheY-like chemotaxis protein